jgi:RNA polymerase sigma factor (TIGR02999 family)
MEARHDVTELLVAWREGAAEACDHLFPLVYEELRRIAHRQLGRERSDHTLGTTALVHEAYLRLVDQKRAQWQDRGHFYSVAAQAMRRILVDYARRHRAAKRGGAWRQVTLDDALLAADERADTLVALDEALARLEALDARLARVVECRFFGGLRDADIGQVLGVTERTVQRDWVKAKAWLHRELQN